MSTSHFRELEVWQLAMDLAKVVYHLTADFSPEQRYGLSSQLQRSAVSIPSNIAEGNGRGATREYLRFASIALGSAAELQTQLLLSKALSFGNDADLKHAPGLCERAGQMLQRLRQAWNQKLATESRVPSPESRVPKSTNRASGSANRRAR